MFFCRLGWCEVSIEWDLVISFSFWRGFWGLSKLGCDREFNGTEFMPFYGTLVLMEQFFGD